MRVIMPSLTLSFFFFFHVNVIFFSSRRRFCLDRDAATRQPFSLFVICLFFIIFSFFFFSCDTYFLLRSFHYLEDREIYRYFRALLSDRYLQPYAIALFVQIFQRYFSDG